MIVSHQIPVPIKIAATSLYKHISHAYDSCLMLDYVHIINFLIILIIIISNIIKNIQIFDKNMACCKQWMVPAQYAMASLATHVSVEYLSQVSKEDSSPRICFFAPRLLQLSVVRCYRQPGSTSSSCSKCCRTSRQWHSPIRAHHASIETTSLATSTATHWI